MIELSADQEALQALGRALKQEADGKALRRDLLKELKKPLAPAIAEIKSGLMSIGSGGLPSEGEPLRASVGRKIRAEAKLSGFGTGVRVKARRTPAVRGFANAPKRLNSRKGWRHRVYGRDVWVQQVGKPGYFDDPLRGRKAQFRTAVLQAMNDMAARIAANAKKG
ncbi:hypothetical protein [Sphaerimonospora thailandensis]|uniref:Uncharacterized protein n=1 Tax=Sphaerimonospora thailandensis TaxID=795644 RepID=A0A8J3VYX0_9ACTN|nr:hypothetical protein [Sphaerimonospora thailandensis]GIH69440.1 hypothetical protein Mth01_16930 [Sphaerimonospora thailandensis]